MKNIVKFCFAVELTIVLFNAAHPNKFPDRSDIFESNSKFFHLVVQESRRDILNRCNERSSFMAVILLLVENCLPLHLVENRKFRDFMCRMPQWNVSTSAETIRKGITELYSASLARLRSQLEVAKTAHGSSKWLHTSMDLWTSKASQEKYCGIRISYINENWELKSHLLSCTLWRPSVFRRNDVQNTVRPLAKALLQYLKTTLRNVGLDFKEICSATTDGGSDIKQAFAEEAKCPWTWCLSHLLNRVIISGLERPARDEPTIVTSIKEAVHAFSGCPNRKQEFRKYREDAGYDKT